MGDEKQTEKILATGWDDVLKASASSGAWLKWENGQIHNVNICGNPIFFEKVWDGEAKRRVRIEVYVPGEGLKNWEMAPGTLREVNEEKEESKTDFSAAVYAIKRVGAGKDTKYRMRYQRQLTEAELAERGAAKPVNGASKPQDEIPF